MKHQMGFRNVAVSHLGFPRPSQDAPRGTVREVARSTATGRVSMIHRRPLWVAALLLSALGAATAARAQVTTLPVNKCLAGKVQGVGKSVSARTACYQKEAASGSSDPDCHTKAAEKFTGGAEPTQGVFGKLEAKYPSLGAAPCLTFGDQADLDADIADFAASVPAATGDAAGSCDAAKIKCVGKYVASVLKCSAKAAAKVGTIDPACATKAAGKLANGTKGCLDKAAAHGDCTFAGSQSTALQDLADSFVEAATCSLSPGNADCGLFEFSSFTFQPAVVVGSRTGPSLGALQATYAAQPWIDDYFTQGSFQGYQRWTVPKSGNYTITAGGARGGNGTGIYGTSITTGGYGAVISGTFALIKGDVLEIVVGVNGGRSGGPHGNENGGGGGTFVKNVTTDTLLLVAGGGGGTPSVSYGTSCTRVASVADGQSGTASGNTSGCVAVTTPSAGHGGTTAGSYQGGGGGGYLSAGADGGTHCSLAKGGSGYIDGLVGGAGGNCYNTGNAGGFGGGGGGQLSGPGAGGGYTGGTSSGNWSGFSTYGGGGGSYNAGASPSNLAGANTGTLGGAAGMGYCTITAL